MTKCPHCDTTCNPLRFLIFTRWTPYKCPKCRKRSKFSTMSMAIVGASVGGLIGGLGSFIGWHHRWLGSLTLLLIFTIVMILGMWFFLKLKPIDGELDSSLKSDETNK